MSQTDSILTQIKKLLGLEEDYTAFDTDIRIHINSALSTLHQLGVGPSEGFSIQGDEESWGLLTLEETHIEAVRSYVYLRVRLLFDPPPHAFLQTAVQEQIKEMEWRLTQQAAEGRINQNGT